MKNLWKILAVAIALGAPSPALAQVGGPYGPGPVPCAYANCTVSNLNVTGTTAPIAGLSLPSAGVLALTTSNGTWEQNGDWFYSSSSTGPDLNGASVTGTVPGFRPNRSAANAGIGALAAGDVSIDASNGTGGSAVDVADFVFNAINLKVSVAITGGLSTTTAALNFPGLGTSSAGTTGTLCWTTSTGLVNVDTTTTCLLSLEELKDIRGPIGGAEALADVLALKPFWGTWKKSTPEYAGDKAEQPFLGAHQVASVDKRLAAYAPNGALHGVRYQELTAILVGAIKAQQEEIKLLFSAILLLVAWNLWLTFRRASVQR